MIPFQFPWLQRETRQETFTDAAIALLTENANSAKASPGSIAALEIALGLWGRAFASATVTPPSIAGAVTPSVLEMIGRELIRVGEVVFLIEVADGRLMLQPSKTWDMQGGPDPASWTYAITLAGPSTTTTTRNVSERRIVHPRYAVDPDRPWRGVGPITRAKTTATLAANVETRLSEETGQSAGNVMAVPDGKSKAALQTDLRSIKGLLALVESTASGWGDGSQGAPKRDLVQNRIGANPPAILATLRSDAALSVLATCGVPTTLLERADGTALRESWRQFLHSSVTPVADIVAAELSDKLAVDVGLSFDGMFASDLSGRARAFQSMVGGGMPVDKAAALAGLMDPSE